MHCIFQWLRRGHAADMVSHLTGPGCLIELNIIRNALDTFRRQTKGSVGVCSDLSDRNLINEARNRIHKKTVAINSSTLLLLLVSIELLALLYILYVQTMIVCGDVFTLPSIESNNSKCRPALPEAWVPANAGTHAELL